MKARDKGDADLDQRLIGFGVIRESEAIDSCFEDDDEPPKDEIAGTTNDNHIVLQSLIENLKEMPTTPLQDQVPFEQPPHVATHS